MEKSEKSSCSLGILLEERIPGRQAGVTNTKANTFQLHVDVKAAKAADGMTPYRSFGVLTCEPEKQCLGLGGRILLGI